MDKAADGEARQDKGGKNKRKLVHPSIIPDNLPLSLIEFPRYELPISQSLNEFNSSELGSDWDKEGPKVHMHELVDWNDPVASQLEELVLSNLQVVFRGAIRQIVEHGYSEDLAELLISRKSLYIEEGDPVSNIVRDTLNILKGKDVSATNVVFDNFQHLLHYTMVEMISVLREVRPSLTVGEAMWVLLICDLNISLACAAEDCLSDVVCNEESSASSIPQSKSRAQISDIISKCFPPTSGKDLSPNHQNHKYEAPKLGSSLNLPNNQSPIASELVQLKVENASFSITTDKSTGTSWISAHECKSGSCSKRHSRKEIAALRQKFLHMEKAYRACGKGGFKSGKLASVGGLVVEKRLKPPSEVANPKMKCGSSNMTSTIGVCSADGLCHVSTIDASTLPEGVSSGTSPKKDAISTSPMLNTNTSKSELSSTDARKMILDYCACIPFDEALGEYVPRDEKDGLVLKLISRAQELQDELWTVDKWINKRTSEAIGKIVKVDAELKSLKKEKQEAELFRKDKKILEENAVKRVSEMENAMENTRRQMESATSATLRLEAENILLKKELDTAKLWAVKSMTNHQEAVERVKMTTKDAQSSESEKALLRDVLEEEKHKFSSLQQELDKEKNHQAKVEGRLEKERVAKEKVLAQAASIRKEREQLEARAKSEEDMIRKKAASDLQEYVEDIAKLEKELVELKLNFDSEKIAALRSCIDESNDSLSRTSKSTPPSLKGNKAPETVASFQDKSAPGDLKREQECVMCLSEEISVVFLPCAHQVVCPECNELHEKQGMKDCPSCRTPIQRRIHARFAGH
ncbi:Zinc finger, RING-type [Sesbania bispinosa]|nr:Zinc finger, RING-type [Sesbania bispinosa]